MHGNVWEWCRDKFEEKLQGGRDPGAGDQIAVLTYRWRFADETRCVGRYMEQRTFSDWQALHRFYGERGIGNMLAVPCEQSQTVDRF